MERRVTLSVLVRNYWELLPVVTNEISYGLTGHRLPPEIVMSVSAAAGGLFEHARQGRPFLRVARTVFGGAALLWAERGAYSAAAWPGLAAGYLEAFRLFRAGSRTGRAHRAG